MRMVSSGENTMSKSWLMSSEEAARSSSMTCMRSRAAKPSFSSSMAFTPMPSMRSRSSSV